MPTFAGDSRVLQVHITSLLTRLQWSLPGDTRDTRLVCLVSCVSSRNPDLFRIVARNPEFAATCARNHKFAAAFARDPEFAAAVARNPEFAATCARNPEFAAAFARDPELAAAVARDPESATAFTRNKELVAAVARDPEFAAACARNPESAAACARIPEFAAAFARNPRFETLSKWMPAPLLFCSDDANRCIKRLYSNTGQLAQTYRAESDTRMHNLLVPNAYDENDLFAIQSKHISRLAGVFIRNETVFSLVRLTWHFKADSEEKEVWQVSWSAELYRVDMEQRRGAEAPTSSLCLAGSFVLCAIAGAHRLAAFEYTSRDEPLKMAGDQRFDEAIVHVDALTSDTRSLVAIAFADGSIRLYRPQKKLLSQSTETRLNLQETFRVVCEHVHKLLFAGDHLLVSARSDDEDEHSIWSCHVMGERVYGEGSVLLDSKISVASWCYDHTDNQIYCVDSATNNIFTVK